MKILSKRSLKSNMGYLNCLFKKRVSNNTVNGIIASFVICDNREN